MGVAYLVDGRRDSGRKKEIDLTTVRLSLRDLLGTLPPPTPTSVCALEPCSDPQETWVEVGTVLCSTYSMRQDLGGTSPVTEFEVPSQQLRPTVHNPMVAASCTLSQSLLPATYPVFPVPLNRADQGHSLL